MHSIQAYWRPVVASLLTLAMIAVACSGDSEDPAPTNQLPGGNTPICPSPAPMTPSYAAHISPIITQRCGSCHQGGNASGGVQLNNAAQVQSAIQSQGLLSEVNSNRMPPSGGGLPQCEKDLLTAWSNTGFGN